MRALKTLLIILAALGAIVVILGLTGPKRSPVQRSAMIAAPVETVYRLCNTLQNMRTWSPWAEKDTAMKVTWEGTEGTIGSKMSWEGNSDVGKGSQEIVALDPNKHVGVKLTFITPFFSAVKSAGLDMESIGDSTRVTWKFDGDNGFMERAWMSVMNADKMMGPDFEHGLAKLKGMAEAGMAVENAKREEVIKAFTFTTADRPAALYVGVRDNVKWDDMHAFFMKNLPLTFAAVGKAKVKAIEPPIAVYFKWDTVNKTADLLAGVAIPADAKGKVQGVTEYESPASKAYQTVYTGPYSGMGKAHDAMAVKMKMDKVTLNEAMIEEYVSDPGTEKDSTKWVTNVIYLVR